MIVKVCKASVKDSKHCITTSYFCFMKQWMLRIGQLIGLVLLLVTLTATLRPTPVPDTRSESLALRQVGHDYLTLMGDVSSRIPAVVEREDGSLLLKLEQVLDYDTIAIIAKNVIPQHGIRRNYTLQLEDCVSGEVFLGSLWQTGIDNIFQSGPACMGREQEDRCANISIAFARIQPAGAPTEYYYLGGFGLLLLLTSFIVNKKPDQKSKEPIDQLVKEDVIENVKQFIQITPNCSLNETDFSLVIGSQATQLTYRESKLLAYLAQRPNEVLARTDIHDAVWGEEGLITGRSLDVFISRLRKKLAEVTEVEIKTVHGVGYRFRVG